ncbi:ABC transporter ATP-binding protein [Streptococcus hyointestinalis]|uniref:ABC transporter ATP-binding protein n=1 Tax=Streptococcus hyointestinalis TaxID=1337 RepID=UPI0023F3F091|nr:ABC transporter ATP-binding protein [Streptococcus hyointestinalis]MDD6384563.1 ABC transporter ATP-binding protein [Streptococcus hyointestinalis]MDD7356315.1 ABC transporter ATP-binding protein [Streptococcus hyointestinalis]
MVLIEVKHLAKQFADKLALSDVSFAVEKGEIFGFLGPSGSGKTTTIKILTGQLSSDKGAIAVLGKTPAQLKRDDYEKIGIVSDTSGFYEKMTLYKNMLAYAKLYGVSKARVDELLKRVNLYDDRNKVAEKLSNGMKQRMLLARALLNEPDLLFLDEPTSGLDPMTTRLIHRLLLELKEKGTAIFLTTHDMHEATLLCDNLALLDKGSLVETGRPKDLIKKYHTDKKVVVTYDDDSQVELSYSELSRLDMTAVESIHSTEPTLEDVFIALTGGKLDV